MTPTVGILTSGGDAPGMNAVLFGAAQEAAARSVTLLGIPDGLDGLVNSRTVTLATAELEACAAEAGTVLRTSRRVDLRSDEERDRCADAIGQLGLDALIVVGGSGSARGVARLREVAAIPIVFVPATIDDDIPGHATTIGFYSAIWHGLREIERLRITARSLPGRAFVVETLGGSSGNLARAIAASAGADAVLVPEEPVDYEAVAEAVRKAVERDYAIVVMSEGIGTASEVARRIGDRAGIRVRVTVLGHGQRAADVSEVDRALGLAAGRAALETAVAGRSEDIKVGTPA